MTVHIDTVSAEHVPAWQSARASFVAELARAHAHDHRGLYYEVDGLGFFSMRPLGTYAQLDGRGAEWERESAKVPKATLEAYDYQSDAIVAFPHRSEIWRYDDELSYVPAGGALDLAAAGAARVEIEQVRADLASEGDYDKAWTALKAALQLAHYPLTRATYTSVFGAGAVVTFWLAPSRAALDAAPTPEAAASTVLGATRSHELVDSLSRTRLHMETHTARPRLDLSDF